MSKDPLVQFQANSVFVITMNESDFLKAIKADPCDPVPRLVYADWLDDQGDPRGELLRIQEELRHIDVPNRPAKEARMHELLNGGAEPLMITETCSIGMELVLIFPGEFVMGSPKKEKGRYRYENQVDVRWTQAFWLGKYPVTQAEWQEIMGSQPWQGKDHVQENGSCPATFVSWEDAVEFCRKLTAQERQAERMSNAWEYTLPTEAQWEYACRAGTTSRYSFGEEDSELGRYAWFDKTTVDTGESYAHPVGQKQPNPWGLSDMHGNVWEWCRDSYADKLPGGCNPEVTTEGLSRLARGGLWHLDPRLCRSATRNWDKPSRRFHGSGFRVARVLTN